MLTTTLFERRGPPEAAAVATRAVHAPEGEPQEREDRVLLDDSGHNGAGAANEAEHRSAKGRKRGVGGEP